MADACIDADQRRQRASRRRWCPTISSPTSPAAQYDGYGSCPLTVERGKIALAEFGYGGALLPSFSRFLIDGTRPSRAAWLLNEKLLPPIDWTAMLRGKEWLARPERLTVAAGP